MVGPITLERLETFMTIRVFRVWPDIEKNLCRVTCKLCGASVEKGCGSKVTLAAERADYFDSAYLCATCWDRIAAAYRRAAEWGWLTNPPNWLRRTR